MSHENQTRLLMTTSGFPPSSLSTKLVNALYAAAALRPRASMGELAALAGISRATLHRYCGTRENLDSQLEQHAKNTLMQILDNSGALASTEPLAALRQLIREHLAQGELIAFLASRYPCAHERAARAAVLSGKARCVVLQRPATGCISSGCHRGAADRDVLIAVARHGRCPPARACAKRACKDAGERVFAGHCNAGTLLGARVGQQP